MCGRVVRRFFASFLIHELHAARSPVHLEHSDWFLRNFEQAPDIVVAEMRALHVTPSRPQSYTCMMHVAPPTTTTEQAFCPGWERPFVPVSQPGPPRRDKRVLGQGTGTNEGLWSRLVTPTGTKGPLFFSVSFFLFRLGYFYSILIEFCIGI